MKSHFFVFVLLIVLFLYPTVDPDLGWHLRYGEYVLNTHHLLNENTFSHILPDYHWVNHSWGYDIIAAILFHSGEFTTHSYMAAILLAITFTIATAPLKNMKTRLVAIALISIFSLPLSNLGLRSQLLSLCFASIVWLLMEQKRYIFLPFIFLLWANIHGQFFLGLVIMGLYLFIKTFTHEISIKNFLLITISSFVATLINPYVYHLHRDIIISYLPNPGLAMISEWQPWPLMSPGFWGLFMYSLISVYVAIRNKDWPRLTVCIVLGILSLQARRIIPWLMITTAWYVVNYYSLRVSSVFRTTSFGIAIGVLCLCLISSISRLPITLHQNWNTYCQSDVGCSLGSAEYLRSHPPHRLWNAYKLGGYLIYQTPQIPVSYDGRMTTWRQGEYNPMLEYAQIIQAKNDYQQLLRAGGYDYVILTPEYPLAQALTATGWPVVYADSAVKIFYNPRFENESN